MDFNFYSGVGTMNRRFNELSTPAYVQMRKEAFANDNVTPTIANARDLTAWDTTRHTDWQKELLGGMARTLDGQLSISGGNAETRFSVGGGYHRENTVFPGNNSDQRISSHASLSNTSSNKRLKTSVSIHYTANISNL